MMAPIDPAEQREGLPGDCGWAARHVPRVSCWAARHVPPRFLSSFFPQERHQAPPWRCGAGLTSELFRRARYEFFFLAPEASWGAPPWRCGAGFNSEFLLRSRCPFQKKKKKKKARGRAARGLGFACVLFCHPSRQAMTAHSHRSSGAERGSRHLLVFLLSTPEAPPPGAPAGSKQRLGQGSAWAPGPPGGTGPAAPSSPPRAPERAPRPPPPPPPPVSV